MDTIRDSTEFALHKVIKVLDDPNDFEFLVHRSVTDTYGS